MTHDTWCKHFSSFSHYSRPFWTKIALFSTVDFWPKIYQKVENPTSNRLKRAQNGFYTNCCLYKRLYMSSKRVYDWIWSFFHQNQWFHWFPSQIESQIKKNSTISTSNRLSAKTVWRNFIKFLENISHDLNCRLNTFLDSSKKVGKTETHSSKKAHGKKNISSRRPH